MHGFLDNGLLELVERHAFGQEPIDRGARAFGAISSLMSPASRDFALAMQARETALGKPIDESG